ncbi:hypothetical protein ACFYRI_31550 [Streptomyces microflavus]|uniref:hypothetical protein n=1 Tax=Streptomyces microflavus TaxID=1919 RepID=UPI0036846482
MDTTTSSTPRARAESALSAVLVNRSTSAPRWWVIFGAIWPHSPLPTMATVADPEPGHRAAHGGDLAGHLVPGDEVTGEALPHPLPQPRPATRPGATRRP